MLRKMLALLITAMVGVGILTCTPASAAPIFYAGGTVVSTSPSTTPSTDGGMVKAPSVVHASHSNKTAVVAYAAPVQTYTQSVQGQCYGHVYTLTGTFQFDPNTGKRRVTGGAFQGRDWTQVIHQFNVIGYSNGGNVVGPTVTVDSIKGSESISGKWGTAGIQAVISMIVYGSGQRCSGGVNT